MRTEIARPSGTRCTREIAALRHDLMAKKLKGDQALALIVERMRKATSATAAAIALPDGRDIVCRASSGNAPSVGARVDPETGLSGECVRTGAIVHCHDTGTDPRVDRMVCRSLELRSIVIVPVRIQGRPAGVLEVFSSRPNAFQSRHELALEKVSDLVAEIAAPQSPPVPPEPEPTATQTPAAALPTVEAATSDPGTQSPEPPRNEETTVSEQQMAATATEEQVAPLLSISDYAESSRMRVVIAGTLLAVLIGAWLGWRAVTPANSMPAPTQLKQANPGAAAVVSEPRPLPPVYRTTGTSHAAPAKHQETKRVAPITLPPPDIASSSAAPEVALLASPAGDSSPISTVLATASVAGPRLDDTKVSQTSGGKLIKKVDPIYPPGIAHDVHGEVVLKATINPRGQVTKISVVRGQPVLARAAITAVMRWRYEPFLLNDVPTEVVNEIVLNFKAPGQ